MKKAKATYRAHLQGITKTTRPTETERRAEMLARKKSNSSFNATACTAGGKWLCVDPSYGEGY